MILSILNELEETNSTKVKQEILIQHKDNELLKECFFMALDPNNIYYITKVNDSEDIKGSETPSVSLKSALQSIKSLIAREYTGFDAHAFVIDLMRNMTPNDAEVLRRVILKDLRCGTNHKTVNKVWENLISEWPYHGARPFNEKNMANIIFPCFGQDKEDGLFFNSIITIDNIAFHTRSGKEFELLGNKRLLSAIDDMFSGFGDYVTSAEMLVYGDDGKILPRKKGNGIVNSIIKLPTTLETLDKKIEEATLKGNKKKVAKLQAEKSNAILDANIQSDRVCCVIWDCITLGEFNNKFSPRPYTERFEFLENLLKSEKVDKHYIELVNTEILNNRKEADEFFKSRLMLGKEGCILKNFETPWEDKKPKHQVKMKDEKECDLRIVGLQEGEGKYAGMLGAFLCESDCGRLKVSVGIGYDGSLSDEMRAMYFDEKYIGQIAEIKYNEKLVNDDSISLFLPRFVEIKDKNHADIEANIK